MYTYYCKNCKNIIGKWNYKYKYHNIVTYCKFTESKNINSVYFLDCKKCKKFIGVYCYHVCKNCFGKDIIFEEQKLKKLFFKYITTLNDFIFNCEICDKDEFRNQYWFFEELTFI